MRTFVLSLVAATCFGHNDAGAQVSSTHCVKFMEIAGHNRSYNQRKTVFLDSIHDQMCQGKTSALNVDTNAQFKGFIEQIPVALAGEGNVAQTKADNFCRNYQRESLNFDHSINVTETVASQSIDAFKHCISAAAIGFAVDPWVQPTFAFAGLQLTAGRVVQRIQTIVVDGFECKIGNDKIIKNGESPYVNLEIKADSTLDITCHRESVLQNDGSSAYNPASVTITIGDRNPGVYTLHTPAVRVPPVVTTAELQTKISELQSLIAKMSWVDLQTLNRFDNKCEYRLRLPYQTTQFVSVIASTPIDGDALYRYGNAVYVALDRGNIKFTYSGNPAPPSPVVLQQRCMP